MIRIGSASLFALFAILLCSLPSCAHAQPSAPCATTAQTVELEMPASGEYWFKLSVASDRWVFMRPLDVVNYWKSDALVADLALAEFLERQLPLATHIDIADLVPISSRIMVYAAADLLQAGKAALAIDGEGFLQEVLVEQKSGPPCNSTRDFFRVHADGTRSRLIHITDVAL